MRAGGPKWHRPIRAIWPAVVLVVAVALIAFAAGLAPSLVVQRTVILMFINVVLVVALYTFSGNSGVVSFGHVSFMAIGAYTCALLTIPAALKPTLFPDMPGFLAWITGVEMDFLPAICVAAVVSAVFAAILAPVLARLAGLQAGIATLAMLAVVYTVILNWEEVTRGSSTMIGVPADTTLPVAAAAATVAIALAFAFQNTRRGLRLKASREDPAAAQAVGVQVGQERAVAWVISGLMAGAGGAVYSHFITTFTPSQFYLSTTFVLVTMLVVGGINSLTGAVVGVGVVSILVELLRRVEGGALAGVEFPAGTAEVVLALLLLGMLIRRPQGLTGGHEVPWPFGPAEERTDPNTDGQASGEVPATSDAPGSSGSSNPPLSSEQGDARSQGDAESDRPY